MEKLSGKIDNLLRVFLFIFSVLFITYLTPKEGKFRYEYQKNKPWQHDALIAPFSFPISKLDYEIEKEKDSILKNFKPHFKFETEVFLNQKKIFNEKLEKAWESFSQKNIDIEKYVVKDELFKQIHHLINFVYTKGILEFPDNFNNQYPETSSIILVKNNVLDEYEFSNFFTKGSAYEYIETYYSDFTNRYSGSSQKLTAAFFAQIRFENFITANIFYDEKITEYQKNDYLKNISYAKGMVLEGERIISTGEYVNYEKFRILESLKKEYENKLGETDNYWGLLAGKMLISLICISILFLFLRNFRKEVFYQRVRTSFIILLLLLFVLLASLVINYKFLNLYIVPFIVVPIIIKAFYDSRLALFVHLMILTIVGFWAPNPFEFIFINFIIGGFAITSFGNQNRRSSLFYTSVSIIFLYWFVYASLVLYQDGSISKIEMRNFSYFAINGFFVLTSIPLVYIFEKMFGFLSETTLLELADSNQPLLRKLAEVAPGTFQHSLQVANLSEDAIYKIGGNVPLIRAAALYHDIGKIENPIYFIENQTEGINPHDNLDFEKSAEIIIGHVNKGVSLARKNRIPTQVIDFILTHHGTTTVQYFYRSYLRNYPDKEVDIKHFTYPGPKPYSREMAVLMMSDSVEAASRSLKIYSEENINNLVQDIIQQQLREGQYNDSNITFREISEIIEIFKKRLKNIYHLRIEYPK